MLLPQSQDAVDLNQLSLVTIFMENAIRLADETFLLSHISSFIKDTAVNVNVNDELDADAAKWMAKCLFEIIVDGIVWLREQQFNNIDDDDNDNYTGYGLFREIFEKLLKTLSCLEQFPQTMVAFKRDYVNAKLCDTVFALKCQSFQTVLIFTEFLLNIDCDKVCMLSQINKMPDVCVCTVVDMKLKTEVLRMMCCKYVSKYLNK